ncbi:MAG: hypothetical protein R3280_10390 [Marinobacter sp.]|uniref:hypothetical protein n=1 Tax=Marinobacter sp. TaxID=50741 RepID=UPI00299ED2FD|nr:hypothetical protein [Marinobacter sp.]MDX1635038.1 hypothetical protein [Marinobacter sp.]
MPRLIASLVTLNLLLLLLVAPAFPQMPWLAAEALVLAGVFLLLSPGAARSSLAWLLAAAYGSLVVIASADALIRQALGRPVNVYLDAGLLPASLDLVLSNQAGLAVLALALALVTTLVALVWGKAQLLRRLHRPRFAREAGAVCLVLGLLALVLAPMGRGPVAATGVALVTSQWQLAQATRQATADFRRQTRADDRGLQPAPLPGLAGRHVVFGFIESYGISALTDPRYRELTRARLAEIGRDMERAGLHVVSGRLRSPVQGGQSWLAHASVLSGLWVDSQLDYDILLASRYSTLIDDFRLTGHDTVAVMPAITRPWPEGRRLGYDRIHAAASMDYSGPALNWVTMPDQYTWSWFDRHVLAPSVRPVFAELALISSHAPWVPILPVLNDWQGIGRGEVFEPWRDSGEAPAVLWRDPERVREHFGRAIDYALAVAGEYTVRYLQPGTLLILLGDHQPAPLITGDAASRDVPVHVISAEPALLAPFLEGPGHLPGFRRGMLPDLMQAGATMAELRGFLHRHFGKGPAISQPAL